MVRVCREVKFELSFDCCQIVSCFGGEYFRNIYTGPTNRHCTMKGIQRGALIVLEGCDRVGKTTQGKLLGE